MGKSKSVRNLLKKCGKKTVEFIPLKEKTYIKKKKNSYKRIPK